MLPVGAVHVDASVGFKWAACGKWSSTGDQATQVPLNLHRHKPALCSMLVRGIQACVVFRCQLLLQSHGLKGCKLSPGMPDSQHAAITYCAASLPKVEYPT